MPDETLFHGIAVLIDDEINDPKASVAVIKRQIEDAGCHVVPLSAMPSDSSIPNFREVAFFVVDWKLNGAALQELGAEPGITSSVLEQQNEDSIVKFLHELRKVRFAPVFIFTNEPVDSVKEKLKGYTELYNADDPSHILVMDKKEVTNAGVFNVLTDWMKSAPSVYVLKSWEKFYEKAKNELFLDFYMKSTLWPLIIWKNFENDSVPPAALIGELIGRNLVSRMTPFECDLKPFSSQLEEIKKDKPAYESIVRKVLEGERFLHNSRLESDSLGPGDIFTTEDGAYLMNIRPDCDCIARGNNKLDSLDLYLLRGTEKAIVDLNFDREHGIILEQDNEAMVFPIYDGKVLCFKFKKLYTKRWRELKANRIGRLLPPYLTRLQQRYSSYLQRPGLSRLPEELFPEPPVNDRSVPPAAEQGIECAPEPETVVPDQVASTKVIGEAIPASEEAAESVAAVPRASVTEASGNNADTAAEIPST